MGVIGNHERHDVETHLHIAHIVSVYEQLGDFKVLPALLAINRLAGKALFRARSRLHLGEDQDIIIAHDDIGLASLARPVARDDLITARHQITRSNVFT